ncbi:MAG TPA: hypothetical protein VLE53_12965 [Gemmatimonadaceae bacterium]|nr:hypothetical protein [Gemmatimonadaceae bacterium]
MTVGDALTRHYAAHGLPADGGESAPWFRVRIGPVGVRLPNPPARQRAVFFHDVNHVLTGYDTTFSRGEMVIAGFEVGNGCGAYWIAWYINLGMFALGLIVCPREMFRAFVRGRRAASIYRRREDRTALAAMPVDRLREALGLDAEPGAPTPGDRARFLAWSVAAVVVLLVPLLAVAAGIRASAALFGGLSGSPS